MRTGTNRRRASLVLGAAVLAVTASGCFLQPKTDSGGAGAGLEGYVDNAQADEDKVVTVLGAFGGDEQKAFEASIKAWEDKSGVDVQYTADQDFTTTIKTKVNSGDSPDIGLFPQPGGLLELAAQGKVQPIDTYLDYDALSRTLVPGFLESSQMGGRTYGAPMRMAVKSIVWYPKKAWEAKKYPTSFKTFQDLMKFSQKLESQGEVPWCVGWESDAATGWVGTDWVEEMMLRVGGPEKYDEWLTHGIPFNDPTVVKSMDVAGEILKGGDKVVLGGSKGVLNTSFAEAMLPAFKDQPGCWMERQGNFATGFYPADVQKNLDDEVGIFVFPPYQGGYEGQPILGGGDIAALFNGNDKDAQEFAKFLTSPDFGGEWAQAGGWLSPHTTFDKSNYPNQTITKIADLAYGADVFRYDGSDVMPKEVGSGTFWTEMVKWEQGESSKATADAIESSWPS